MKTGILTKSQLLLLGILVAIIVTLVAIYYQSNSEGKSKNIGNLLKAPTISFNIPPKVSYASAILGWATKQFIDRHNN